MTAHAILAKAQRQDLCCFVQRCFHELHPGTEFAMNWHLEVLAAKLDEVLRGKLT